MSTGVTLDKPEQTLGDMPGPKGNFLLGNLPQIDFAEIHQYLKRNAFEYGPVYRLSFARIPVVVLSDPDIVRTVLKNRPERYRRISSMESVFSELGVNGVFSAEGEPWKAQRKMMNQAFKYSQIENYYPIIKKITERLHNVMNQLATDGKSVDMQALLQRFTVDITSNLAFAYDIDSLSNDDSEFQQQINIVFPMISDRVKAPFPYWRYFKLKKDKQLDTSIDFIKQLANKFIQQAEANIQAGKTADNILEAMIVACKDQENGFTEEQLFPNIVTLLLAGEDTTANTLGWVLYYLSSNPDYQQQLYEEITQNLSDVDLASPADLETFPLLNAVIQEAMRLMPVAPLLYLENIYPETIAGYQIPAGTMLINLLAHSGHLPEVFEQPEEFIPQRWLNISAEKKKQYAKELMHFGSGPRQCPGMQLSFIEMKYALVMLLKNFTFSLDEQAAKTRDVFAFTVMPKNLMLKINARENGQR